MIQKTCLHPSLVAEYDKCLLHPERKNQRIFLHAERFANKDDPCRYFRYCEAEKLS